jgi:hypothetical protein
MLLQSLIFCILVSSVLSADKNKPHGHSGALDHYTGKPIPVKITADQSKVLDKGNPVSYNEQGEGKSGRGVVIQDVNASTLICMSRIRDLTAYPKMVPHVNKVEIYENIKHLNVNTRYMYHMSCSGCLNKIRIPDFFRLQSLIYSIFQVVKLQTLITLSPTE